MENAFQALRKKQLQVAQPCVSHANVVHSHLNMVQQNVRHALLDQSPGQLDNQVASCVMQVLTLCTMAVRYVQRAPAVLSKTRRAALHAASVHLERMQRKHQPLASFAPLASIRQTLNEPVAITAAVPTTRTRWGRQSAKMVVGFQDGGLKAVSKQKTQEDMHSVNLILGTS
jgi:hypothetical protein